MGFTVLGPLAEGGIRLPMYSFRIPAGFPSPATDHMEKKISMDEMLNVRAAHVYLVTIDGDSMQGVGIFPGMWQWLTARSSLSTGMWWWRCSIMIRSVSACACGARRSSWVRRTPDTRTAMLWKVMTFRFGV